jgi:hypothetical protein
LIASPFPSVDCIPPADFRCASKSIRTIRRIDIEPALRDPRAIHAERRGVDVVGADTRTTQALAAIGLASSRTGVKAVVEVDVHAQLAAGRRLVVAERAGATEITGV